MTSIICGVAKIGNQSNFKRVRIQNPRILPNLRITCGDYGFTVRQLVETGVVDEEIREKMIQTQESQGQPKLDIALNKASDGWSNLISISPA